MGCALPSSSKRPVPPNPPPTAPHSVPFRPPTPAKLCLPLQVNTIPASFHDGLLLYVQAVTETLAHGGAVTDGEGITQRMWNRSFQGQGPELLAAKGCLGSPKQEALRNHKPCSSVGHLPTPAFLSLF